MINGQKEGNNTLIGHNSYYSLGYVKEISIHVFVCLYGCRVFYLPV